MKALLSTLIVIVLLIITGISMFASANNTGVNYEAQIKAQYNDNKQALAGYGTKIQEEVQVPGLQTDALVKIITAANGSRYGAGGNKSTISMIREVNPGLDQSVYTKLSTIIDAGRSDFVGRQTKILDVCRSYEAQRGYFLSGFILRIAGFPKDPKLAEYCTVVTSDYSDKSYSTGHAEALKLGGS